MDFANPDFQVVVVFTIFVTSMIFYTRAGKYFYMYIDNIFDKTLNMKYHNHHGSYFYMYYNINYYNQFYT